MASIDERKKTVTDESGRRKVKTVYRVRYRTPTNEQRNKTFDRKADAAAFAATIEADKTRGMYVDPSAGRESFRDYAERWRKSQVHRPGTAAQVETNLRRHVYPRIGSRPMGAIRQREIQELVKAMSAGSTLPDGEAREPLAPATVTLVYMWIAIIFTAALADRAIGMTPCTKVSLPPADDKKVVPIEVEVVHALEQSIAPVFGSLVTLGAGTGVRISEALGLTVDRIDWKKKLVTIDRQLVGSRDGCPLFGPVKDRNNRPRTVPLPNVVVNALQQHLRLYGTGPEGRNGGVAGLVFTGNARGTSSGPVSRTTFSDAWRAAAGPLGIPLGDGFHQLRHFYASLLIRHGESVKVVQNRLGHRSAQTTLDIYGHMWPDSDDTTRAAVDLVLGAVTPELDTASEQ